MNTSALLSQIDAEIRRLQDARALLAGTTSFGNRPRKKRFMSAAARARIAAAQKKRWAKWKKANTAK